MTRDPVTAFTHSGMSEAEGQGRANAPPDFSPALTTHPTRPRFFGPHITTRPPKFSDLPASLHMRKRKLSNQDKQVLLLFIIIQKVDVNLHTYLVQ